LFFRDVSLELALKDASHSRARYRAESGQPWQTSADGRIDIYQDSSGGDNWKSRNHVNRHGVVPCSFRGYRVRAGGQEQTGLRARPVLALETAVDRVTAAVPEFWQQFPRAVGHRGGVLRLGLFPAEFADLFELQGGEQKRHTVWLHFGPTDGPPEVLDWVHHP